MMKVEVTFEFFILQDNCEFLDFFFYHDIYVKYLLILLIFIFC